jgi:hypothetical protein
MKVLNLLKQIELTVFFPIQHPKPTQQKPPEPPPPPPPPRSAERPPHLLRSYFVFVSQSHSTSPETQPKGRTL